MTLFGQNKKIPTDLEILNYIYKKYYKAFISFSKSEQSRGSKIYIPIDCKAIAEHFKTDGDIIFGRLYYHLENKYKYQQSDNCFVHFFALKIGNDSKCINFAYMSSILAELQEQDKKYRLSIKISLLALFISILSSSISIYDKLTTYKNIRTETHVTKN